MVDFPLLDFRGSFVRDPAIKARVVRLFPRPISCILLSAADHLCSFVYIHRLEGHQGKVAAAVAPVLMLRC